MPKNILEIIIIVIKRFNEISVVWIELGRVSRAPTLDSELSRIHRSIRPMTQWSRSWLVKIGTSILGLDPKPVLLSFLLPPL